MQFGDSNKESSQRATIGASVSIKGEISGDEDILIEGAVEGTINLKQNMVTVAKTGKVKANVNGVVINVEGEVFGDLAATEQIVVHKSGRVRGNLTAPRISVEDGARVRGQINTDFDSDSESVMPSPRSTNRIEVSSSSSKEEGILTAPRNGRAADLTRSSSLV